MDLKIHHFEESEIEIDGEKIKTFIPHYFPPEPSFEELLINAYRDGVNSI